MSNTDEILNDLLSIEKEEKPNQPQARAKINPFAGVRDESLKSFYAQFITEDKDNSFTKPPTPVHEAKQSVGSLMMEPGPDIINFLSDHPYGQ